MLTPDLLLAQMTSEAWVGVAAIVGTFFLALLSVIGTLVLMQVKDVKAKVAVLPQIEIDLGKVVTTQSHHSKVQDDLCERVTSLEDTVRDKERLAKLEQAFTTLNKDVIDNLRPHVHKISNVQARLGGQMDLLAQAARIEFPKPSAATVDSGT